MVGDGRMQYTEFLRIEKLKRILDLVAYGSLIIDYAIAIATLISFNIYSTQISKIQYLLNLALTCEVLFTTVLLISLAYLYHYEKILDHLAEFSSLVTGKRKGDRNRR